MLMIEILHDLIYGGLYKVMQDFYHQQYLRGLLLVEFPELTAHEIAQSLQKPSAKAGIFN